MLSYNEPYNTISSVIMKTDYGVNQIRTACFGNHLLRSVNAINQRLQERQCQKIKVYWDFRPVVFVMSA